MRVVYFGFGRKSPGSRLWLLAGLVALLGLAASRGMGGTAAPEGGLKAPSRPGAEVVLRVGIAAEPTRLDPHDASDAPSSVVNFHIYDRLVELDENMQPQPSLATNWSRNETGDVWRLSLRRGVVFHDGTALDARAVKESFDRLLDPELGLARRSLIAGFLKEVVVIDPLTVEFRLLHPVAPFLKVLAHDSLAIVGPSAGGPESFTPVGTGPFYLREWTPGTRLVLEAFPEHWRGAPAVDRIVFLSLPAASSRAIMLQAGEIDVAYPVEAAHVESLRNTPGVAVETTETHRLVYLALNTRRPPFDDSRARVAVSRAIDREGIARHVLFGLATPAYQPLAPGTWGYSPVGAPSFDPAGAKEAIESLTDPTRRRLSLWGPQGRYPQDRAVAQAVGAFLAAAGFDVEIRLFEWGAYLGRLGRTEEWNLALLGWASSTGDADMALRPLFYSGSRSNHSGYSSAAVDALIDAALRELDPGRRLDLYREAIAAISAGMPVVPLYVPHLAYGRKANVLGIRFGPSETLDLRSAHFEGVRR